MPRAEVTVLKTTADYVIIEIVFAGGDWADGSDIRGTIKSAVLDNDADAVVLNLSGFRYRGGDYASGFMEAFFDRERKAKRPACFLGADRGIVSLFNTLDPQGILGVCYFDDRDSALRYVQARLEP